MEIATPVMTANNFLFHPNNPIFLNSNIPSNHIKNILYLTLSDLNLSELPLFVCSTYGYFNSSLIMALISPYPVSANKI
jgi:hypothetical protein